MIKNNDMKKLGRPPKHKTPPVRIDVMIDSKIAKKLVKAQKKAKMPMTDLIEQILYWHFRA